MYIYDLPTTGAVSFSDFLVTTDLVSQVSQTTQLRARLRAVLKENRAGTSSASTKEGSSSDLRSPSASTNASSPNPSSAGSASDWLLIIKTLEEYLPHLLAVYNSVQTDDLILRYEPVFSWRTSVSSSRFRGPQRVELPGLYYELASTLLTYALTLSNFASATVAGLGSFERDRNSSSDDRKQKDEKLRWAADTLCRAAGILAYLSEDLLPRWRDQAGHMDGLPPDLTTEVTLALSKVCLAEAQALAIRKLVSPSVGLAVDTVTPGPPLEKGHPSASLLAKLHLCVVEEMESAAGLMRTVGERKRGKGREVESARRFADGEEDATLDPSAGGGSGGGKGKKLLSKFKIGKDKETRHSGPHDIAPSATNFTPTSGNSDLDIAPSLLKYLSFSIAFHKGMAFKWLGIDHGESTHVGSGIAFLSLSSSLLSSSKDLSSGLTFSITSSSLLPQKKKSSAVEQELSTITHWLSAYRKLNDTVAFQPVPSAAEVTAKVPAGRAALGVKAWKMPVPTFGPGSEGYADRSGDTGLRLDQLHLLEGDHPARRGLVALQGGEAGEAAKGAGYAGQGAYY